jgi:hypothetical protein
MYDGALPEEAIMPKDHPGAFAALRGILSRHARTMTVQADTPIEYTLVTQAIGPNRKPVWFGCVLAKKSAVTYHLMPLYYNPKLLAEIAPGLRRRMQGKTCFNFQRPDPELFAQLDSLTRMGLGQWKRAGFLEPGPISPERLQAALKAHGAKPGAIARKRKAMLARRAAPKKTAPGKSVRAGTAGKA